MSEKYDPAGRLIIATLAARGELSEKERTEAVKYLLEDGLTVADVGEQYPGLLDCGPATLAETAADRSPTVRTTLDQSQELSCTIGSGPTAG